MAEKQTYGYTPEFQTQIAALILRDAVFMREYGDVIDPNYFDVEELQSIVRIGRDYFDKHQEIPTRATLLQEIQDYCISFKVPKTDIEGILRMAEFIYKDQLHALNGESVRERITRFGRRQAVRQGVMSIIDLVETDQGLDKASDIMDTALRVGYNANEMGLEFFQNVNKLHQFAAENQSITHKIKTHIREFDEKTMGGPGRGEVWVALGISGAGKSQWLVNIGVAALDQGFPVAHVTIGDLDEKDVSFRYFMNLAQCNQYDIINDSEQFKRKSAKLAKYKNYLRIKYYDPGVPTVGHIKAWLSKIHTIDGVKPGLLIVDYPDEMKIEGDNTYLAMGRIYGELKALAKQYNMVVWVASQINRWQPTKDPYGDVIRMNNIADSAKKVHKADGIISLNQTIEENATDFMRLWVDKVRRGKKNFMVNLEVDFSQSRLWQSPFKNFEAVKDAMEGARLEQAAAEAAGSQVAE